MLGNPWFWSTLVLLVLLGGLVTVHFRNPWPLLQIPEIPHHLYFTKNELVRNTIAQILYEAGHEPYGSFSAGVDQLLLRNGTTVLALADASAPKTTLVIPVTQASNILGLVEAVTQACELLKEAGVQARPASVPGTKSGIVRLHVEDALGYDIALRLPGRQMTKLLGFPKFTRWHPNA